MNVPTQKKLRVGILSMAHMHSQSYASALAAHPGVEFVGIADADAERGRAAAIAYSTTYFETSEALLRQGLDGIIVTSENVYHRVFVEAAAKAGVRAILCEKPIATTIEDARAMIDACNVAGAKLAIAFPCRYSPAFQRLREQVQEQAIGDIIAIRGTNHGKMPGGWFIDKSLSGGGAVLDHTVHVADLNRRLLGVEAETVYAEIGNGFYHQDFDDTGFLNIRYSNGVFATLDTSWSRPENLSYLGRCHFAGCRYWRGDGFGYVRAKRHPLRCRYRSAELGGVGQQHRRRSGRRLLKARVR